MNKTKTTLVSCVRSLFFAVLALLPATMSQISAAEKSQPAAKSFKEQIILADQNGFLPSGLVSATVVYIGENHTEYANHVRQLDLIQQIYQKKGKIAIGMEMFSREQQNTINDYLSGKITERDFLVKTNYFLEWGYDYNYYRNIIEFARKNKIDIVGLNIRNAIVQKIGRNGLRDILPEEFQEVPDDMDFSNENYKDVLSEIFTQHSSFQSRQTDNFYFAQILRDEYMAQSVARYLGRNPDKTMIVIAGNGHIENGYGIPMRLKRISGKSYKTALMDTPYKPGAADYFIYTRPQKFEGSPVLKLMLVADHGKMKVTGLIEHKPETENPVENPVKAGDIIESIDGTAINSIADIRLFLYGKKAGEVVKIQIIRDKQPLTVNFTLFSSVDDDRE